MYMYYYWMKHLVTKALYATKVVNLEAPVESTKKRKARNQIQSNTTNYVSDDVRLLDIENREESLWGNLVGQLIDQY